MAIFRFESTGEAYDACQCREGIKTGDVLHIPSEKVVGLAWTAPFALTRRSGELHYVDEHLPGDPGEQRSRIMLGVKQAVDHGLVTRVNAAPWLLSLGLVPNLPDR